MNNFNNLGVGDLALIISSNNEENLMKTVKILEISKELFLSWPDSFEQTENPNGIPAAFVEGDSLMLLDAFRNWYSSGNGWIPLENLMPLKGDFKKEEEVQDVLLSLSHN